MTTLQTKTEEKITKNNELIQEKLQKEIDENTALKYKQKSLLVIVARAYKDLDQIRSERFELQKEIEETEANKYQKN